MQVASWWLSLSGSFPYVALVWVNGATTVKGLKGVNWGSEASAKSDGRSLLEGFGDFVVWIRIFCLPPKPWMWG